MINESIYLNGELSNTKKDLSGNLSEPLLTLYGAISQPEVLSGSLANETLRGYSAYDLAVLGGYEGTLEEWLDSLAADSIEIRNQDGIIEYKYSHENMWTILIDLSSYTNDYELLINKPSLDGVVLSGNRDLSDDYMMIDDALSNEELENLLQY